MTEQKTKVPAYVGGVRHEPVAEEQKQPPVREQVDDALDLLQAKRRGESVGRDREPARDVPTIDDAAEQLEGEKAYARADSEREAERAEQQQREQAEQEVQKAATWNDAEQRELQERQSWMEVHEDAKKKFIEQQRWAQANPGNVSDRDRDYLAQQAQQLKQQEQFLQNASQEVQQASAYKQLQAEQRRLFRDVPELKDKANRERLVKWAVENKGVTEEAARAEQRRSVIAAAWKEMQKEERAAREKRVNRPRRPPIRDSSMPRAGLTVEEAKSRLKSRGRVDDALNLMHVQRERAREMNDDS